MVYISPLRTALGMAVKKRTWTQGQVGWSATWVDPHHHPNAPFCHSIKWRFQNNVFTKIWQVLTESRENPRKNHSYHISSYWFHQVFGIHHSGVILKKDRITKAGIGWYNPPPWVISFLWLKSSRAQLITWVQVAHAELRVTCRTSGSFKRSQWGPGCGSTAPK